MTKIVGPAILIPKCRCLLAEKCARHGRVRASRNRPCPCPFRLLCRCRPHANDEQLPRQLKSMTFYYFSLVRFFLCAVADGLVVPRQVYGPIREGALGSATNTSLTSISLFRSSTDSDDDAQDAAAVTSLPLGNLERMKTVLLWVMAVAGVLLLIDFLLLRERR